MPRGRTSLAIRAAAVLLAGTLGVACHSPGGPLYSADKFTYVSTEFQPWTVTVIDTRTGEAFWSVDVPVGEQLVVQFSRGTGPNEHRPDEIVWELMPAGRWFGALNNRQPCPPSGARRLDPTLRAAPEMPGSPVPGSPFDATEPRPVRRAEGRVVVPYDPYAEDDELGEIQRPDPEPEPDAMEIPEDPPASDEPPIDLPE
jgi:hypothetical protein